MTNKTCWWIFTNYDLDLDYQKVIENTTADYICYGKEVCPSTKREHHQGWIHFSGARGSVKNVAAALGKCNVRMMKGTIDQNDDYCSKESDLICFGIKPKQGRRSDLDAIKTSIETGKSVDDICMENPNIYHQYARTLSKIEDIVLRKRFRTWMTEGIWIVGSTGSGKSHMAYENYDPVTHYTLPNDKGWWDGYVGQEIVVINEFRGNIIYSELLDLCDKWPKSVPRRGREPVPFLAKKIIITSSMRPKEVYCNLSASDGIEQLLRRFELRVLDTKWSKGNTEL